MEEKPYIVVDHEPAHTNEYNDENPSLAIYTIDRETAERIIALQQAVIDLKVVDIRDYDCRVHWVKFIDDDELPDDIEQTGVVSESLQEREIRTELDRLVVTDMDFRFESLHKYCDDTFSTSSISVSVLAEHFGLEPAKRPETTA